MPSEGETEILILILIRPFNCSLTVCNLALSMLQHWAQCWTEDQWAEYLARRRCLANGLHCCVEAAGSGEGAGEDTPFVSPECYPSAPCAGRTEEEEVFMSKANREWHWSMFVCVFTVSDE